MPCATAPDGALSRAFRQDARPSSLRPERNSVPFARDGVTMEG